MQASREPAWSDVDQVAVAHHVLGIDSLLDGLDHLNTDRRDRLLDPVLAQLTDTVMVRDRTSPFEYLQHHFVLDEIMMMMMMAMMMARADAVPHHAHQPRPH